jgi:hypothetical protein
MATWNFLINPDWALISAKTSIGLKNSKDSQEVIHHGREV